MSDPFDVQLGKLHGRGPALAMDVGGSALVVHCSSSGAVQLSATPNLERAIKALKEGRGRQLLRQLFGSGGSAVVELQWLEVQQRTEVTSTKARREAWVDKRKTLQSWAAKAEGLPGRRPYLLYIACAGELICCCSSEGRELMGSEWWRDTVLAACAAPPEGPLVHPAVTAAVGPPSRKRRQAAGSSVTAAGVGPSGGQPTWDGGQCRGAARQRVQAEQLAAPSSPPEPNGAQPQLLAHLDTVDLLGGLAPPSAPEGSAQWYGQCLANNPALIVVKQLARGVFVLPNYDPMIERAAKRITSEPVQVGRWGLLRSAGLEGAQWVEYSSPVDNFVLALPPSAPSSTALVIFSRCCVGHCLR